jgi:hypothetical protein
MYIDKNIKTHYVFRPLKGHHQVQRAIYTTLKFIKSNYRSVLTKEHLTELVRTALTAYQLNFKKLTAYT